MGRDAKIPWPVSFTPPAFSLVNVPLTLALSHTFPPFSEYALIFKIG